MTVARGFPYWREPVLPAGWTFGYAFTGGHHVSYGYCASYYADDGFLNVEICGEALSVTGTWGWYAVAQDDPDATTRQAVGETRVISGRPAVVMYSPEGPLHHPRTIVRVRVYDPGTDSLYTVNGVDPSLLGSNVEGVIAIARSLFEPPNPLPSPTAFRYDTYDTSGEVAEPRQLRLPRGPRRHVERRHTPTRRCATARRRRSLIHKSDAHGASQAALYDGVEAGDLFEWRYADDCWTGYRVTGVEPDPTGAAPRKLLALDPYGYAYTGCSGVIAADASSVAMWREPLAWGGPDLAYPVVYGVFQVVPGGWTGELDLGGYLAAPGDSADEAGTTESLAEARAAPLLARPSGLDVHTGKQRRSG